MIFIKIMFGIGTALQIELFVKTTESVFEEQYFFTRLLVKWKLFLMCGSCTVDLYLILKDFNSSLVLKDDPQNNVLIWVGHVISRLSLDLYISGVPLIYTLLGDRCITFKDMK